MINKLLMRLQIEFINRLITDYKKTTLKIMWLFLVQNIYINYFCNFNKIRGNSINEFPLNVYAYLILN